MKSKGYIPSLDGIRAVSVMIVFIAHVGFGNIVPGGLGVTIFFFLSGFLITTLLTREWDQYGSISQIAFYTRRLLRLGPPIIITLILCLVLLYLGFVSGDLNETTVASQIFFFYNYYSLYGDGGTVDGLEVLWSLSVEEHFYFLWPSLFIFLAMCKTPFRYMIVLLAAILTWRFFRLITFGTPDWVMYISTDTRLDSLGYGCFLALLIWKGLASKIFPDDFPYRSSIIAGAFIALLASLVIRDDNFRSTLRYSIQGVALMPIFYYAVTRPDDLIFRFLSWKYLSKVGQWSYTIYLGHFVIINMLVYNGFGSLGSLTVIAISTVAAVGYGAAVFYWVERPLHGIRKSVTGHSVR